MSKSKSSRTWLQEHFNDPYVIDAKKKGYRSRAVFKLLEIQAKDKLIKPGMTVVDLGAAPGGWSQVAREFMQTRGTLVALDILPMDALAGVTVLEGDFTDEKVLEHLKMTLNFSLVDLVMSDMAPNISGIESSDQARAMYLAELALDFAVNQLKPKGDFLVKVFQGSGFDDYVRECRTHFARVVIRKPKASRPRSKEVYILGKSFKGQRA